MVQSLKQGNGWGSTKYRTEYTRCKWLTCLHMVQRPSHIKRSNMGLIRKQQASSLWAGLPTSSVPIPTHECHSVCAETKGQHRSPSSPFTSPVGPRIKLRLLVLAESSHTHWAILLALILFFRLKIRLFAGSLSRSAQRPVEQIWRHYLFFGILQATCKLTFHIWGLNVINT